MEDEETGPTITL